MKLKYSNKNINNIKSNIDDSYFINKCRLKETSFIRNRKISSKDLVLYGLNKKGLSTKMEILNFNDIKNVQNISSPGLLKQREKLNPEAFKFLIQNSLRDFYSNYKSEVKTIKGYVLLGIDGSDFEIPNNKMFRYKYNGKMQNQAARVTVSTCYDILNKYTLDILVNKYKVKTNRNMSVGIFKNTLIYILLEDDNNKRGKMMEKFSDAIKNYIIPIKPNRKNNRQNNPKNRYHLNQRKTY